MSDSVPKWKLFGDWFDVCKCNIPCSCTFAQAPSDGECQGVLAYHINSGHYGETPFDGLNVIMVSGFKGNIWAGEAKMRQDLLFDERLTKSGGRLSTGYSQERREAFQQNLQRSLETS